MEPVAANGTLTNIETEMWELYRKTWVENIINKLQNNSLTAASELKLAHKNGE